MSHSDCRCETLVRSEIGQVSSCQGCGQVHVALDYMTLRFDPAAFRTLVSMVSQAQYRLDGVAQTTPSTVPHAAIGTLQ